MISKDWLRFALPALVLVIAGCGGGGGGGSLPTAPASGGGGGGTAPSAHTGKFVINVPSVSGSSAAARKAQGISAGASSVAITVTGVTASQLFDISASSPNCVASSGGGRSCTLSVQAGVGADTFTVTIFDGPSGTGHQLASGTATTTVTSGIPFSVTVTLSGVVASLQIVPPGSGGSGGGTGSGGGGGNGFIPVGQPASGVGTVIALDPSGNVIVGPYNTPVNLTSSDPSITVGPATVNGSGTPINFAYDGKQSAKMTVTASAGSISTSLTVTPQSNIVFYQTPTANTLYLTQGPDGAIYFNENGPVALIGNGLVGGTTPGKIARLDPNTGLITEQTTGSDIQPFGIAFAADGSMWFPNTITGTLGHLTSVGGTYTSYPIPSANSRPRFIVPDGTGNMWFAERFTNAVATFNPATPGTIVERNLPTANSGPISLALGSDGNIWVSEANVSQIAKVTVPGGAITEYPLTPTTSNTFVYGMSSGPDGNLYVGDVGNGAYAFTTNLYKVTTAGAVSVVPYLVPSETFFALRSGTGSNIVFGDGGDSGLGLLNTATGAQTIWPISQGCFGTDSGPTQEPVQSVIQSADGSIWYDTNACGISAPTSYVGHLIFAAGWTIFPQKQTIYLSPGGLTSSLSTQLIGIAESGDSSPFTVSSSSGTVASIAPITGSTHNFKLTGLNPGSTTITITDKNGVSQNFQVSVTGGTGTIQSRGVHPQ